MTRHPGHEASTVIIYPYISIYLCIYISIYVFIYYMFIDIYLYIYLCIYYVYKGSLQLKLHSERSQRN